MQLTCHQKQSTCYWDNTSEEAHQHNEGPPPCLSCPGFFGHSRLSASPQAGQHGNSLHNVGLWWAQASLCWVIQKRLLLWRQPEGMLLPWRISKFSRKDDLVNDWTINMDGTIVIRYLLQLCSSFPTLIPFNQIRLPEWGIFSAAVHCLKKVFFAWNHWSYHLYIFGFSTLMYIPILCHQCQISLRFPSSINYLVNCKSWCA